MVQKTAEVPKNAEAGTKPKDAGEKSPHDVVRGQKPINDEMPVAVRMANRMTDDEALKAYASLKNKENRTPEETRLLSAALMVMMQEKIIVVSPGFMKRLAKEKPVGAKEVKMTYQEARGVLKELGDKPAPLEPKDVERLNEASSVIIDDLKRGQTKVG